MGTRKNTLVTLLAALAMGCASSSDTPNDNAEDGSVGGEEDGDFEPEEDALIDDFEDNNDGIETLDGRTGSWYTFNDGTAGGVQTPEGEAFKPSAGGANGTMYAATTTAKGFTAWGAGLGVDLNNDGSKEVGPENPKGVFDGSKHTGIAFYAKGSPFRFSVKTTAVIEKANGGTCEPGTTDATLCDNGHGVAIAASKEWKLYKIPFANMKQDEGWGQVIAFDAKKIVGLQFQLDKSAAELSLSVDEVAFY